VTQDAIFLEDFETPSNSRISPRIQYTRTPFGKEDPFPTE
jgi:hypothetical protein